MGTTGVRARAGVARKRVASGRRRAACATALLAIGPVALVTAVGGGRVGAAPMGALSAAATGGATAPASPASSSLVGYNASALAIGAQFAFNVPNLIPLPNENLVEEDVPFARTTLSSGPVVDSLAAPFYPGDVAADIGSLLAEFGAPALVPNDPLLAQSKFPTSPGDPARSTFGVAPASATGANPSIFSSSAATSAGGGAAVGTLANLSLDNLAAAKLLHAANAPAKGQSTAASNGVSNGVANAVSKTLSVLNAPSLIDVGNISSTNNVTLGASTVTASATTEVAGIDIAGLIDISSLLASSTSSSDGTTGTPTASLHLGQVTVDGESAYINATGVHLVTSGTGSGSGSGSGTGTGTGSTSITPAQLQQSVDATLSQDGIAIRVLDPQLTTTGADATADAGGLQISISHQFDVPYIPGEPTIPVPDLGSVGLPAGLYTATTSLTFGLAQTSVNASGLASSIAPLGSTGTLGTGTGAGDNGFGSLPSSLGSFSTGSTFATGSGVSTVTQQVPATGPGSATGVGPTTPGASSATAFPIRGVPAPIGWSIAALLACLLAAYPLLLVARWQFVTGRRR